jgi:hypothetical protein
LRRIRTLVEPGDAAPFTFTLALADSGAEAADAAIDYRVHYVGARGVEAPKVFKLTRRRLGPGQPVTITRPREPVDAVPATIRPAGKHPSSCRPSRNGCPTFGGGAPIDAVGERCRSLLGTRQTLARNSARIAHELASHCRGV